MRPTLLSLYHSACARAVSCAERGDPYDRSIYHAGTAAHAVLQAIGEKTNELGRALDYDEMAKVARAVCEKLIAEGRSFDGEPEPPLPSPAVWRGRDIALNYIGPRPLEPGAHYELGLAVDADWKPVPYVGVVKERFQSSDGQDVAQLIQRPHMKTILDVVRLEEGDGESEYDSTTLTVRDYKSAFPTGPERLNHPQQRAQAVLAAIHFPEASILQREVVNLMTGATFADTMYLGTPEADEQLEEWRQDIESEIQALERMKGKGADGLRPASPNPGCHQCPYLSGCDEALEYMRGAGGIAEYGSPEEIATLYSVAVAVVGHSRDLLCLKTNGEPVEVERNDGAKFLVGYQAEASRELAAGAHRALLEEWLAMHDCSPESVASLLHAHALSVTGAEKVLKLLYPEKGSIPHREEWLAANTQPTARKVFRAERVKEEE